MATWTNSFSQQPPGTQDHGRGGVRIQETRQETLARLHMEHNAGDATTGAGYSDDGRHSPGSARAFVEATKPTALQRPDGGGVPTGLATGAVTTLSGAADEGRLWVDTGGTGSPLRYLTAETPIRFTAAHPFENHLMNGSMQVWQRNPNTAISCPIGVNTYSVDRWYVNPAGGAGPLTVQRALSTAPTWATPRSSYALQMNGLAGITSVVLGTRIEGSLVPRLRLAGGDVNFSFRIRNNCGNNVTPSLAGATANAPNDFSGVTNFVPATHGGWAALATANDTYYSYTFDTTTIPNDNGFQLELTLTGAITGGQVWVGEVILEWGQDRSNFVEPPFPQELAACQRYYEKTFRYSVTPASGVEFNGAILVHGNNSTVIREAISGIWFFKQEKLRTNYTVGFNNPGTALNNGFWNVVTDADTGELATTSIGNASRDCRGDKSVVIANASALGAPENGSYLIHATCEADLV